MPGGAVYHGLAFLIVVPLTHYVKRTTIQDRNGRAVLVTPSPWQTPEMEVSAMPSQTSPRPRVKVSRSAKVQHLEGATILWLTVDKNTTAYRVTRLPHAFGKAAFHLQKADKGDG